MRVHNHTRDTTLMTHGEMASSFWTRLKGLLGRDGLSDGEGLILKGEKSIHMFFMKFAIDVVYVNDDMQVIRLDENMPPWKIGPFVAGSAYVIELPVGTIARTGSKAGDTLAFHES